MIKLNFFQVYSKAKQRGHQLVLLLEIMIKKAKIIVILKILFDLAMQILFTKKNMDTVITGEVAEAQLEKQRVG